MTNIRNSAPHSRSKLQFCLILLCVLAPSQASADVYKWTGDDGKINYTQMPPPSGQTSELIRQSYTQPQLPQTANSASKPASTLQSRLDQEQRDKQSDADKAKLNRENTEIRRLNCDAATRNLAALEQSSQRSFRKANGEIMRPTDKERKALIKNARQQVKDYCNK